MSIRQVTQGRQTQGVNEQLPFSVTTTPWSSSPTSVSARAYDISASGQHDDVTATVMPGSPTVSGDVIILPLLVGLVAGKLYRVEVRWNAGTTVFETYFEVQAEL